MVEEDSQLEEPSDLATDSLSELNESQNMLGGFDDNVDDLSPNKEHFEDAIQTNAEAHHQNNRISSLSNLPPLPPPTDSSQFYNQSQSVGNVSEHPDEHEMQRHLNDVESSFMPVLSPTQDEGRKGMDDTYLFDGARGTTYAAQESGHAHDELPALPHGSDPSEISADTANTTSSLETMSSSPTAAAAARTVSRAISVASMGGYASAQETGDLNSHEYPHKEDIEETPRKQLDTSYTESDGRSTLRHHLSRSNLAADAGNTPGIPLLNRKISGKGPKFLRSRHASQHSSVSSINSNLDDGNDITMGADYALQSGGAVPSNGFSRSSSMALSRSISLGSMASGIEDLSTDSGRVEGNLATLTEEEQNHGRIGHEESSPPETPRAASRNLTAPTDTIIARHVQNVQVPESVAQEYRNKNGVSPKKSGFSISSLGRGGKNLTLKEQSSTIERLSKENFDLKLKVMFLSDRLDKLSEEGVKEMISENVELKTGLAVMQRDNKALKRRVKELEKQLKDDEGRPSTSRSVTSNGEPGWFDQDGHERDEELVYLRDRVEEYIVEIEKLRHDAVSRENEKRNLAEVVRQMGERRGQNVEVREEMDVWKDLLEQETARREQADEENARLRDENFRLKSGPTSGVPGLNHTTNIYNITKKRQLSPSRPRSGLSERLEERNGTLSSASTLVEDLRRESEQLRHENAELRREVGAQTSMLTSRNREKERLYQEIEDLKLGHRRGGSAAGDSILERSASRAHERPGSRASVVTRVTIPENEREDFENRHGELRDRINSLKIQNQDLQRELESCMDDFETAVEQKKQAETLNNEMQEALDAAESDLFTMQTERDEALQGQADGEEMFANLQNEAQQELDAYAEEVDKANAEIEHLQVELSNTTESFNALRNDLQQMSTSLIKLEDDHETKDKRIQDLERELEGANRELEELDHNLEEANTKINRLGVQQESSQNEISFLREEQEGDKIKIGDLESALNNAERSLRDERDRIKDLEQRLANERHQRELVAGRKDLEVQRVLDDLNREASTAKDEAKRLKKNLSSREAEAADWKQRLMDLENNLKEALGDLNGTRSSLLNVSTSSSHLFSALTFSQSIGKLQHELEKTIRELDGTKSSLAEKEALLKQRDNLMESHALDSRKIADMLDKERTLHRSTKHQFESFQRTHTHTSRSLTQHEARVLELETTRQLDRKKITTLENNLKDQMDERNQLLLVLWKRLSSICGNDWAHDNSLINGRALPSLETLTTMFPGFSKNLLAAVKTIETLFGDFRSRIRSVEKDLWKEYQTLESNLEVRTKRLDRLETMARSALPGVTGDGKAEINKLREANKQMMSELGALRATNNSRSGSYQDPSPSPSVPTGPRQKALEKTRASTLTRHQSTSAVETLEQRTRAGMGSDGKSSNEDYRPDMRWQIRLQELEYKLVAEREARKLDRTSARQRLEEKDKEVADLAKQVERNKVRGELSRSQPSTSSSNSKSNLNSSAG